MVCIKLNKQSIYFDDNDRNFVQFCANSDPFRKYVLVYKELLELYKFIVYEMQIDLNLFLDITVSKNSVCILKSNNFAT